MEGNTMDTRQLDALKTTLATELSRRTALRPFLGGGAAALLAGAGLRPTRAVARQSTPASGEASGLYLVIRRYTLAPDASVSEITEITRAGFVPIVAQVPGFVEYFTYDAGNRDAGTISIFTDAAAADESTRRAAAWVAEADLGRFFAGPPEVIAGNVLLHVQADAAATGTPTA
jgi:hypothetical protein